MGRREPLALRDGPRVVALAALPVALHALLRRGEPVAARACGVVTVTLSLGLLASVALLSASTYGRDPPRARPVLRHAARAHVSRRLAAARPRAAVWLSAACAAASLALAALLPERLIVRSNDFDAPTASFVLALDDRLPSVPFRVWALGIAAVGVGTFLLARRPLFPIATVLLAFFFLGSNVDFRDGITAAQARSLAWVDHSLPDGARAGLVYLGSTYPGVRCQADRARQDLTSGRSLEHAIRGCGTSGTRTWRTVLPRSPLRSDATSASSTPASR